MTEKEMMTLFIKTLKYTYYTKLPGNLVINFSNIVLSGEWIQHEIKIGKIIESLSDKAKRGGPPRGEDEEVQQVGHGRGNPLVGAFPTGLQPYYPTTRSTNLWLPTLHLPVATQRLGETFTLIPMTYIELYPKFIQS